jgi:hypothetical protein
MVTAINNSDKFLHFTWQCSLDLCQKKLSFQVYNTGSIKVLSVKTTAKDKSRQIAVLKFEWAPETVAAY